MSKNQISKGPEKIFSSLSVLFNNKNALQNVNDFNAWLFYQYSPFIRKTIARKDMKDINPSNDINEIFKKYGGNFFILKGEGPCISNNRVETLKYELKGAFS